jgi:glucosamine--fructose-6-phosphate aminotransferase (isomerizing)
MCGITVRVGDGSAVPDLLSGLENLEYRGYDSAGIALQNGTGIDVVKSEGKIDRLHEALDGKELHGAVGIGHTRWSTHGPPTDENAHPHTDCTGKVAVVHNGIIENYRELRE